MIMKDMGSGERKISRMNEKEEDCDDYGCHLPGAYYGLAIGKCYICISRTSSQLAYRIGTIITFLLQ